MLIFPKGVGSTTAGSDGHAFVNAKPSWDGRKLPESGMAFLVWPRRVLSVRGESFRYRKER